jgi:hypothetical protein
MSAGLARNWWAVGLRGMAAVLFGLAILVLPSPTIASLVLLFAAYVTADGIFAILAGARAADQIERWWTLIVEGVTNLTVAGAVLVWLAGARGRALGAPGCRLGGRDRGVAARGGAAALRSARALDAGLRGRGFGRVGRARSRCRPLVPRSSPADGTVARRLCAAVRRGAPGPRFPPQTTTLGIGLKRLFALRPGRDGHGAMLTHIMATPCRRVTIGAVSATKALIPTSMPPTSPWR